MRRAVGLRDNTYYLQRDQVLDSSERWIVHPLEMTPKECFERRCHPRSHGSIHREVVMSSDVCNIRVVQCSSRECSVVQRAAALHTALTNRVPSSIPPMSLSIDRRPSWGHDTREVMDES